MAEGEAPARRESNGTNGAAAAAAVASPARSTSSATPGTPASPSTPPSGQNKLSAKDFEFGREIGEGSYSRVLYAKSRQTGEEFAIKIMEKRFILKEGKAENVKRERDAMAVLSHPSVVRLHATFQDAASLYMVLEYCGGGDLFTQIKALGTIPEEVARFYAAELLSGIEYLRSKGVVHRDLKPENMLITASGHLKITDFGSCKIFPAGVPAPAPPPPPPQEKAGERKEKGSDDSEEEEQEPRGRGGRQRRSSFCGTAEYVSPEVLLNRGATTASDLWALACVVFQMLAGRPPFRGGSEYLTFQKILGREVEFPEGFPPAARDFVERLLQLEPSARAPLEELRAHPWLAPVDFSALHTGPAPRLPRPSPRTPAPACPAPDPQPDAPAASPRQGPPAQVPAP
eukprot:tig00021493_g21874.t1